MSRTKKGTKGPGFDYGSRRPGNRHYASGPPGATTKKNTHHRERIAAKAQCRKELDNA